ncbi:MAG: SRPBCC domain-containing protein [Bacteroidetes bacterium]|nr:SRPBCC domain-containing protein [Bacteroidota bacterium]
MNRLKFSIDIHAPQNLVWSIMWSKETFEKWMLPMGEGHYYESALFQGGNVRWLTPSGDGMFGKVKELIPEEKIVFEHHGWVLKGINCLDDPFLSEEKFILSSKEKVTRVELEVDTFDEYVDLMKEKYPQVLVALKEIAEQHFFLKNQNFASI